MTLRTAARPALRSTTCASLALLMFTLLAGCATAPPSAAPGAQALTFEQKMTWILRLEEDRLLEFAQTPAPVPAVAAPGRAAVAPAPTAAQPSLLSLLKDEEARIRRRAALAAGRTRLAAGVPALEPVMAGDPEPEVRQMAAFALGLIGHASAVPALTAALNDPDPLVQGRAAEALGLMGMNAVVTPGAAPAPPGAGADAIAAMMATHIQAGALQGIAADDLGHPKSPATEAVRLGLYALTRLRAYDALASVALGDGGRPVSDWWPVAYAFRRIDDPRAGGALLALLESEGSLTRAFAARGLGVVKEARAVAPLVAVLTGANQPTSVRIEAVRSLADLDADAAVAPLLDLLRGSAGDPNLRLEAVAALGQIGAAPAVDFLIDLLTDRWPTMRAAALTALARIDSGMFLSVISGLNRDAHWSVRAALATALGTLDAERAQPRLSLMLEDDDQRVIPAVLNALVAIRSPLAEAALRDHLDADDTVVRMAAAAGLVRLKVPDAASALAAAYDRSEKDPTYVARAATLAALVELDPAAARPVLERALQDRDWAVRVRAAALMRTIDPESDAALRIRPAPASLVPELNDLAPLIAPAVSPVAHIETEKGTIQIELAVLDAPRTVANFISLARRNFLGGTPFHRVVPNFVVQDGDSRGDGEGGPGYTIRDEINQRPYLRGTVGMALDWEDTGGSQFFITHSPQPHLDGRYTVFGHVVDGMDVVDRLQQWDQIRSVRIWDGVNWTPE